MWNPFRNKIRTEDRRFRRYQVGEDIWVQKPLTTGQFSAARQVIFEAFAEYEFRGVQTNVLIMERLFDARLTGRFMACILMKVSKSASEQASKWKYEDVDYNQDALSSVQAEIFTEVCNDFFTWNPNCSGIMSGLLIRETIQMNLKTVSK